MSSTRKYGQIELTEYSKDIFAGSQTICHKTINNRELYAILSDACHPVTSEEAKLPKDHQDPIFISVLLFEGCRFTDDAFSASADFDMDPLSPLKKSTPLISIGFQDTTLSLVQAELLIKARIESPNQFALSMLRSEGAKVTADEKGGVIDLINEVGRRIFSIQEHWLMVCGGDHSDETKALIQKHNDLVRSYSHYILQFSLYMINQHLDRYSQLQLLDNSNKNAVSTKAAETPKDKNWQSWLNIRELYQRVESLRHELSASNSPLKAEIKVFLYELSLEIQIYLPPEEYVLSPHQVVAYFRNVNIYYSTRFAFRTEFMRDVRFCDGIIDNVARIAKTMSVNLRGNFISSRHIPSEHPLLTMSIVLCQATLFAFVGNLVKVKRMMDINKIRAIIYEANRVAFFNDIERLKIDYLPHGASNDIAMAILVYFESNHLSIIMQPDLEEQKSALQALRLFKKIIEKDKQSFASKLAFGAYMRVIHFGQNKLADPTFKKQHSKEQRKLLQGYLERLNVLIRQIMLLLPPVQSDAILFNPASIRLRQLNIIEYYHRCLYVGLNAQPILATTVNRDAEIKNTIDSLQRLWPDPEKIQTDYLQYLAESEGTLHDFEVDLYTCIARHTNNTTECHIDNVITMLSCIIAFYKSWLPFEKDPKGQTLEQQLALVKLKAEQCVYAQKVIDFLRRHENLSLADVSIPSDEGLKPFLQILNEFALLLTELPLNLTEKQQALAKEIAERDAAILKAKELATVKSMQSVNKPPQQQEKKQAKPQPQPQPKKVVAKKAPEKITPAKKSSAKVVPISISDQVDHLMASSKWTEAKTVAEKELGRLLEIKLTREHYALIAILYFKIADCIYLRENHKTPSRRKKYPKEAFEYLWKGYDYARSCLDAEVPMSDNDRSVLGLLIEAVETSEFFADKQEQELISEQQEQVAMSDVSASPVSSMSTSSSASSSTSQSPSIPDVVYRCPLATIEKKIFDKLAAKYGKENVFMYGSTPSAKLFKLLHGSKKSFDCEDIDWVVFTINPKAAIKEVRADFGLNESYIEELSRGEFEGCKIDVTVLNNATQDIHTFLSKRDVSMKAIALDYDGNIIDSTGFGVSAITRKRVEFLPGYKENPDPIIYLNYIRGALYPDFQVDEDKLAYIKENKENLRSAKGFVLLNHFRKHFLRGNAVNALRLWRTCNLFEVLLPVVDNALYDDQIEKSYQLLCERLDAMYASSARAHKFSIYYLLAEFLSLALWKQVENSNPEEVDALIASLRDVSPLVSHLIDDEIAKITNRILGLQQPVYYSEPNNLTLFTQNTSKDVVQEQVPGIQQALK